MGKLDRIKSLFKDDYKRRTVALSIPSLIASMIYAAATGIAAFWSRSLWLGVMTVFYIITIYLKGFVLGRAGASLVSRNPKFTSVNNYRLFSIYLLVFDIMLGIAVLLFYMNGIYKKYPGYTIFITAMYVIVKVILASINMVKAHKTKSFTTIALRKIDSVKAIVSFMILVSALLSRYGDPHSVFTRNLNSAAGFGSFLIILIMSLDGLIVTKKARNL